MSIKTRESHSKPNEIHIILGIMYFYFFSTVPSNRLGTGIRCVTNHCASPVLSPPVHNGAFDVHSDTGRRDHVGPILRRQIPVIVLIPVPEQWSD